MQFQVCVKDRATNEILYSCGLNELESAYKEASKFEAMGLDVIVDAPNVNESLANALGIEGDRWEEYEKSMDDEIHDHDGSCCVKASDPS